MEQFDPKKMKALMELADKVDQRKAYQVLQKAINETEKDNEAHYTRKLQDIGVFLNIVY